MHVIAWMRYLIKAAGSFLIARLNFKMAIEFYFVAK